MVGSQGGNFFELQSNCVKFFLKKCLHLGVHVCVLPLLVLIRLALAIGYFQCDLVERAGIKKSTDPFDSFSSKFRGYM